MPTLSLQLKTELVHPKWLKLRNKEQGLLSICFSFSSLQMESAQISYAQRHEHDTWVSSVESERATPSRVVFANGHNSWSILWCWQGHFLQREYLGSHPYEPLVFQKQKNTKAKKWENVTFWKQTSLTEQMEIQDLKIGICTSVAYLADLQDRHR